MCGIAGILIQSTSVEALERRVENMQVALRHRGPDDEGIYISPKYLAALAHTRLSILDLTPAGHQPMPIADGRYWITFNGEIYNFRELRQNLIDQGIKFQSQTDTEVILQLYQRHGPACVNQLRGMFAFAIWDDLEQTCFIARDPLGIKPLYYWQSGSTLVFASELRAVLASGFPRHHLSPMGLYGYLTSGSVPEPYTLIDGIHCLPAGHWLQWQAGAVKPQRYWQLRFGNKAMALPEAQERVRQTLIDSIQHHFVSDVPVGLFLSGGIDSTALLALARHTQTADLQTYSITFAEPEWNEGAVARKTAQYFSTLHTEYCLTPTEGRSLLPKFLDTLDQPSIDGFNTFCVSHIAHQNGTKVALSGLGGDELFGGYKSFQTVPQLVRWGQALSALYPLSVPLGVGLERWHKSPKVKRIGEFLQKSPTTKAAYRGFRGIFSHREACAIMPQFLPDFCSFKHPTEEWLGSFPSLEDEVSALEISCYMRNQLLRDSDVMSMAWGLELRVPFVDAQFVEAIASIPNRLRLAPGKRLLIQSIPELPDWVIDQPKRGFSFPFQQWFDSEWQDLMPSLENTPQISQDLWYRRWSLAVLHHWRQQNLSK